MNKIYEKGDLPEGEHIVMLVFDGHKPTKSWGGKVPKPAFGIMKIEKRKQPRVTLLNTSGSLGFASLTTWILRGDDISVLKGSSSIRDKDIAAFKDRVFNRPKNKEVPCFKVWWGLR